MAVASLRTNIEIDDELTNDVFKATGFKTKKEVVTIRKTANVIIASFCIETAIPLLFSDIGFKPFVKNQGLTPA